MKYVKKIAAIFCAVMMVVTINASVVNAASTDEGNPTVITLISGDTMSGSAAGIFAEGETVIILSFLWGRHLHTRCYGCLFDEPDGAIIRWRLQILRMGLYIGGLERLVLMIRSLKFQNQER